MGIILCKGAPGDLYEILFVQVLKSIVREAQKISKVKIKIT